MNLVPECFRSQITFQEVIMLFKLEIFIVYFVNLAIFESGTRENRYMLQKHRVCFYHIHVV